MLAGIDLGLTLIKIAYEKNKKLHFLSSADCSISQISIILKQNEITTANITGVGKLPQELKFLEIKKINKQNLIDREIKLQVIGLCALEGKLPQNFILVSIGTGISYTAVKRSGTNPDSRLRIYKYPIGSSIAGGTILGLSEKLGFKNFNHLVECANKGNHKKIDIYFNDLIVSNLGFVNKKTNKNDLAAGLMNLLAITVYKDMVLYKKNKEPIIFIGSVLNNNDCLKKLLKKYFCNIAFIKNSSYAGCLGALVL
ncbi:MAG: hypothetical protein V1898_02360 [Patescibacteria group bacterium]